MSPQNRSKRQALQTKRGPLMPGQRVVAAPLLVPLGARLPLLLGHP